MNAYTNDFDFINGSWNVHNHYLQGRLKGSTEWIDFDAHAEAHSLLNGAGQIEQYSATRDGKQVLGTTLRLLNPTTGEWSLYWADNIRPGLQPPMIGKFVGDIGDFFGDEEVDRKRVLCRFRWTKGESPRWEQAFSPDAGKTWELNWVMTFTRPAAVKDFPVVEFRRYTIEAPQRAHFAQHFDAYFPEATQQLGAMILGQFVDRTDPLGFTWIRGFRTMDDRASVNNAIYNGPLWKEHSATMNRPMLDYTNVLLLRSLHPIPVLPAVDPASELGGSTGIVVTHIFAVQPDQLDGFASRATVAFASLRSAGVQDAGLLVTLDAPNNFPRLPYRADGPFIVHLSVLKDESAWQAFRSESDRVMEELNVGGGLRSKPERIVSDPTLRSRLRWLDTY